jgi:hypothetical protein
VYFCWVREVGTPCCRVRSAQCPDLANSQCKVFTDSRIHRAPDCGATYPLAYTYFMTLSPPTSLSDAERLDALRRLDQFREWRSLEDRRYCLLCGKIITGRQIQVGGGTRGNGQLRLSCPTERCNSIPMDWVLPTDELLAVANAAASEERNVVPPREADHGIEHARTSQLRGFAVHFERTS